MYCFSKTLKKPLIPKIDHRWTWLPYAVLATIVLTSTATLSTTYCEWLCPFKAVTEYVAIDSLKVLIQTIIFIVLFLTLVIVLPILTKKRTQCSFFCPFGAFQSFFNKINIFEVRLDREKCVICRKCIKSCPTFSLDETFLSSGKTLITCTKCGRCVDECAANAISYHIKGTGIGIHPVLARNLFLYAAFILGSTFCAGMIQGAIYRLIKLLTTGSMI
jgi:polyferredoxin